MKYEYTHVFLYSHYLEFTMKNSFTTWFRMTASALLLVFGLIAPFRHQALHAQTVLSNPESIVWDAGSRTYLVSNVDGNKGTGSIVRRNANGTLSPFVTTGLTGPKGMVIAKFGTIDALWVVDVTILKAYNLTNGAVLGTYPVPNTGWLFDIAADSTAGVLYLSDRETGIIRASVSVSNMVGQVNFTTIVSGAAIANPNGLSFDRANRRLLAVSFADGAAQIAAVNLSATPATVQTLFTTPPSGGGLDGIARDKQGRYYVTSWDANNITRYDSNFTSPTVIASGFDGPADIFFNSATDTLVVPNFLRNTLDFIRIPPPTVSSVRTLDASAFSLALAPNPATERSTLSYKLPKAATVSIALVNMLGQTLATWEIGNQSAGEYQHSFSLDTFPAGVYYCRVQADDEMALVRVNLIR